MSDHQTVLSLWQLLEAGFPKEHIVSEAKRHLLALAEADCFEGREEAIEGTQRFITDLTAPLEQDVLVRLKGWPSFEVIGKLLRNGIWVVQSQSDPNFYNWCSEWHPVVEWRHRDDRNLLTEDQVWERLAENHLARVSLHKDGSTIIRMSHHVMVGHVMVGTTNPEETEFLLYPRHDNSNERQRLRRRLLTIFEGAENVRIHEKGVGTVKAAVAR